MILAVLSAAQFLLALDYSIVYVALPAIARELDLDLAAAQWVVSAYAVPFAGLLLLGGRLCDRLGAGRVFLGACLLFGAASLAGGLAGSGPPLLAARGVQGLAAALLQPAILGLIGARFTGPARTRALSVWGAVGASGLAAGVVLGGLLTRYSWRWTFLVNVPVTLACAAGAAIWLLGSAPARPAPAPLARVLVSTAAAVAAALGLTLAGARGWSDPAAIAALVGAALLGAAIVRPAARLRPPSLRAGSLAAALYMASVGSEFYVVTLMLQDRDGFAPLEAGLAFLPLAALVTVGSSLTARLVRRFGAARTLGGGFAVAAASLAWLALAAGAGYPGGVLPGLLVSGAAHGVVYTAMFVLGARDVPAERQSSAGATMTTAQYLAGAVAVALLTLPLRTGAYAIAFWLTAAAAVAGALVALRQPQDDLGPGLVPLS
ncbi:MFS transporter [Dactylosporangium sp. CA-052675]|uniref:MFS transporter n=1 Tax=Dactylosporangium sp. CA-052675 TaxID=3239927 RepID=UPI003D8A7988